MAADESIRDRDLGRHPKAAVPVILIGGANGAGKTFLAGRLTSVLNLDHRLGTGFIREVIRSEIADPTNDPVFFRHTYEPPDPVKNLYEQAARLYPAVLSCIRRAVAEGTSLVIEGTHIVPELYADVPSVTSRFLLRVPRDLDKHRLRVNGPGHLYRARQDEPGLARIRAVDSHLAHHAAAANFREIPEGYELDKIAGDVAPVSN